MWFEKDTPDVIDEIGLLKFKTESEAITAVEKLNSGSGLTNEIIDAYEIGLIIDEADYTEYWGVQALVYRFYPPEVLEHVYSE